MRPGLLSRRFTAALPAAAVAFALGAMPAHAEFLASMASLGSSASSQSSGASSDSLGASSDSSRKDDRKVGQGRYRVMDIAAAKDRPDTTQVALQAEEGVSPDARQSFNLFVPSKTLDKQPLVKGQLVQVKARDYGLEFADDSTQRTFFLVLDEGWRHQMALKPVAL